MPLVSVIMVAHRDTPYLRPAIRSVLTQTWRDVELVFVDNGIGLRAEDLGEMGRDERIRWVALDSNRGLTVGVNEAVKNSRGEFIALLDSDDIALPDRIARQVAAMEARPELGMLFMTAQTIDREGRVVGTEFTLADVKAQQVFGAYDMPATTPTYLCRREVMQRFPYREELDVASDFDFFTRVSEHWSTAALPEVGIQYRRYPEQSTVERRSIQVLCANIIRVATARRRAGRPEEFSAIIDEYQSWLNSPPDLAVQYAAFAKRCQAENFPLLAVYFARKTLSIERGLRRGFGAAKVVLSAIAQSPRQTVVLMRMFLTGPLRTFGLRPVVEENDS